MLLILSLPVAGFVWISGVAMRLFDCLSVGVCKLGGVAIGIRLLAGAGTSNILSMRGNF